MMTPQLWLFQIDCAVGARLQTCLPMDINYLIMLNAGSLSTSITLLASFVNLSISDIIAIVRQAPNISSALFLFPIKKTVASGARGCIHDFKNLPSRN